MQKSGCTYFETGTEALDWLQRRGKHATCCLQPQGKSSVRVRSGNLILQKCMEKCSQLLGALLQSCPLPASLEKSWKPKPQMCGLGSGRLGNALAWLVSAAGLHHCLCSERRLACGSRARATLVQGVTLCGRAGSRGGHGGRKRVWKGSRVGPVVRGQGLVIMYPGCTWSHCSLCP